MSTKVYELVQQNIIRQLEHAIKTNSVAPWQKPWIGSEVILNYISRKHYCGINKLLLPEKGEYLTFKQIQDLQKSNPKIKLRKGSQSQMVLFWKFFDEPNNETMENVSEQDSHDKEKAKKPVPICRYYNVFNVADVDGLESKIPLPNHVYNPDLEAEKIIANYVFHNNIDFIVKKGSDRAYYVENRVVVPDKSQFSSLSEYYSTIFHELVHSTGHKDRLNRNLHFQTKGDISYSKEELVAEIGSNFILSKLGMLENNVSINSINYLHNWLNAISNDVTLITIAAQQAEKAANLILHGKNISNNIIE